MVLLSLVSADGEMEAAVCIFTPPRSQASSASPRAAYAPALLEAAGCGACGHVRMAVSRSWGSDQ